MQTSYDLAHGSLSIEGETDDERAAVAALYEQIADAMRSDAISAFVLASALGTPDKRKYAIARVEWRCRKHPGVFASQRDHCYCRRELEPVIPIAWRMLTTEEFSRLLDQRNRDEHEAREKR